MHFWLPCLCIGLLKGNQRQKKNIHNEAKMLQCPIIILTQQK